MGYSRTARQIVIPQPRTHNLQLLVVIKLHIKKINFPLRSAGYFVGSFYYDIVITRLLQIYVHRI